MSDREFTHKTVPGLRILGLSAMAPSQPGIPPLVGPLFDRVVAQFEAAGVPLGMGVATYQMRPDGSVEVVAGFEQEHLEIEGLQAVELHPGEVVSTVHYGSMDGIGDSWQALMGRVREEGWTMVDVCRELYLEAPMDDPAAWVTELQQPVVRS